MLHAKKARSLQIVGTGVLDGPSVTGVLDGPRLPRGSQNDKGYAKEYPFLLLKKVNPLTRKCIYAIISMQDHSYRKNYI